MLYIRWIIVYIGFLISNYTILKVLIYWNTCPILDNNVFVLNYNFIRGLKMSVVEKIIVSVFESDDAFQATLSKAIKEDLDMTVLDFSEQANIPPSTMYKILSGNREPNIKTLRQIVKTVRKLEGSEHGEFIAVIAARPVLDSINETKRKIGGTLLTIREYSATSIEEAIIAAVRAEREGAKALVCAPIVSTTVEKILRIPVATIMPKNSMIEAIELAAKKIV